MGIPGCGDSGGEGGQYVPDPQEDTIFLWEGRVYDAKHIEDIALDSGRPYTLKGDDSAYDYFYYPDVKLTFKVKKDTKLIEKISKGKVTQ